ncbi:Lipase [Diplonema papillatum]|nr:Lipase [Diplonema papillatum]
MSVQPLLNATKDDLCRTGSIASPMSPPSTLMKKEEVQRERAKALKWGHTKKKGPWQTKKPLHLMSNFRLETMSGKSIKSIMLLFYASVAFAFFTKVYSERVLELRNLCGGDVSSEFGDWNSSLCMREYHKDDFIPVHGVPGVENVSCPSEMCLKWDGEISGMSILNKMVFMAFVLDGSPVNQTGFSTSLWFGGWVTYADHVYEVPPSSFRANTTWSRDVHTWEKHMSTFTCKSGQKCDLIVFGEPFYVVSRTLTVQLLLLNADALYPVLFENDDLAPGIALVYHFWLETLLELAVRYGALFFVVYFFAVYIVYLGCKNFRSMKPHFRQYGAVRSRPWMIEQKWTVVVLFFSILYLNPAKLPSMVQMGEHDLRLDGAGWNWNDRVIKFIDANLPFYFINLLRMYELLIIAACCKQRPKLSVGKADWSRSLIYIFITLWYLTFLLQDWVHVKADYRAYYVSENTDPGLWGGELISNSLIFTMLVFVWIMAMIFYMLRASKGLVEQHYWPTKSRQLSFRFFLLLYLWHVVYSCSTFFYCVYKYSQGRTVLDQLVCKELSYGFTVGDTIANIVFVLILAQLYSPVVFDEGQVPPEAMDRAWVTSKWPTAWITYVNHTGNSTMYFFLWEKEREAFLRCQQEGARGDSGSKSLLFSAMRKALDAKKRVGDAVAHSMAQAQGAAHRSFTNAKQRIIDASWNGSLPNRRSTEGATLTPSPSKDDGLYMHTESGDADSTTSDEDEKKVKPLFSLELAVDLLCISWEVYGDEPGRDHSKEAKEGKMPIDCKRHNYELLEVIHACASEGRSPVFEKMHPKHDHMLAYRYIRSFMCCGPSCSNGEVRSGMCYACKEPECHREHSGETRPYCLCRDCFKNGLVEEVEAGSDRNTEGWLHETRHKVEDIINSITSAEIQIRMSDLQAIICKNEDRIVIAFRGTHCFQNVRTDFQMFRDVLEEMVNDKRTTLFDPSSWVSRFRKETGFGLPRCHRGFLQAFRMIRPQVMARLVPIIEKYPDLQICCTGHSLGGALAMLMAYWIKKEVKRRGTEKIVVYTFGSPRVGNAAFAETYDHAIPHSFRVVNQCDIVPTVPFGVHGAVFKHSGREVCIDKRGNLIIEPTFVERFIGPTKLVNSRFGGILQAFGGGRSLSDHMMVRYARSLNKVAGYFKVPDCELLLTPHKKAVWIHYRKRWDPSGQRCVLCYEKCKTGAYCSVNSSKHIVKHDVIDASEWEEEEKHRREKNDKRQKTGNRDDWALHDALSQREDAASQHSSSSDELSPEELRNSVGLSPNILSSPMVRSIKHSPLLAHLRSPRLPRPNGRSPPSPAVSDLQTPRRSSGSFAGLPQAMVMLLSPPKSALRQLSSTSASPVEATASTPVSVSYKPAPAHLGVPAISLSQPAAKKLSVSWHDTHGRPAEAADGTSSNDLLQAKLSNGRKAHPPPRLGYDTDSSLDSEEARNIRVFDGAITPKIDPIPMASGPRAPGDHPLVTIRIASGSAQSGSPEVVSPTQPWDDAPEGYAGLPASDDGRGDPRRADFSRLTSAKHVQGDAVRGYRQRPRSVETNAWDRHTQASPPSGRPAYSSALARTALLGRGSPPGQPVSWSPKRAGRSHTNPLGPNGFVGARGSPLLSNGRAAVDVAPGVAGSERKGSEVVGGYRLTVGGGDPKKRAVANGRKSSFNASSRASSTGHADSDAPGCRNSTSGSSGTNEACSGGTDAESHLAPLPAAAAHTLSLVDTVELSPGILYRPVEGEAVNGYRPNR